MCVQSHQHGTALEFSVPKVGIALVLVVVGDGLGAALLLLVHIVMEATYAACAALGYL